MKRIAVIGAGLFGLSAALILSKKYEVDVYEKNKDILLGVSGTNQLRFHLGYHYPRAKKTIKEVQRNNKDFIKFYGSKIFGKTNNYYGISKLNSKTSFSDYLKFLKKNNLNFKKKFLKELDSVEGSIISNEMNLNIFKIKKIILIMLKKTKKKINLFLNSEFKKDKLKNYHKIIIAAYENNNLILKNLGIKPKRKYKYELVEKTIIQIPSKFRSRSYMIIDGRFLCIDPFLGTKFHLLSSNKYSKIEVKEGFYPNFQSFKKKFINKGIIKNISLSGFKKYINHGKTYFKFMKFSKYVGSFYLVRVIERNKEKTDERLNKVDFVNEKVITLLSGKWNTSVSIAKDLLKKIDNE